MFVKPRAPFLELSSFPSWSRESRAPCAAWVSLFVVDSGDSGSYTPSNPNPMDLAVPGPPGAMPVRMPCW